MRAEQGDPLEAREWCDQGGGSEVTRSGHLLGRI